MENKIKEQIQESYMLMKKLHEDKKTIALIEQIANVIVDAFRQGRKLLIAGNGGSAADAQHLAGEFVSRFYFDRPGLPAIALTTDTSILTAIGNDYDFSDIFSRQVQAQGSEGDVFLGITTSGNSLNIIKALNESKRKGLVTLGLSGTTGGDMYHLCDYCIRVPSSETPRIQEAHILVGHIICGLVEKKLFEKGI